MAKLFNREWSKLELLQRTGQMDQLAGIRLLESEDGKGRGCRILDVWTGSGLRFQVNAERALDISSCDFKGLPLAWRSPAGDVHPAYYEPQGLGFLFHSLAFRDVVHHSNGTNDFPVAAPAAFSAECPRHKARHAVMVASWNRR